MPVPVDGAFLELVQKRGYSMLHLISDEEYAAGLDRLERALATGPLTLREAGETLLWLVRG